MWLATRYATKRPPRSRNSLVNAELGQDAPHYRRLVRDYEDDPEMAIGPDETFTDHYRRLKAAKQAVLDRPLSEAEVAARQRGVRGLTTGGPAGWLKRMLEQPAPAETPSQAPVSDLKGMPQRVPGWYTGDAVDSPPPGYGVPPMPRRDPGVTMRSPTTPTAMPPRQTRDEWVRGLADKGIYLNPDGTRMTPEQLAAPLPRRPSSPPLRGHDIWAEFTRPVEYAGRHRASRVVVAYVTRVLSTQEAL